MESVLTSVSATANPSLELSLGEARPLTRRRIEYLTSSEFFLSSSRSSRRASLSTTAPSPSSEPSTSSPLSSSSSSWESLDESSSSSPSAGGANWDWKCCSVEINSADDFSRFCFEAEDKSQNRGSVVDMVGKEKGRGEGGRWC